MMKMIFYPVDDEESHVNIPLLVILNRRASFVRLSGLSLNFQLEAK